MKQAAAAPCGATRARARKDVQQNALDLCEQRGAPSWLMCPQRACSHGTCGLVISSAATHPHAGSRVWAGVASAWHELTKRAQMSALLPERGLVAGASARCQILDVQTCCGVRRTAQSGDCPRFGGRSHRAPGFQQRSWIVQLADESIAGLTTYISLNMGAEP
jgi:hypothetical protein